MDRQNLRHLLLMGYVMAGVYVFSQRLGPGGGLVSFGNVLFEILGWPISVLKNGGASPPQSA